VEPATLPVGRTPRYPAVRRGAPLCGRDGQCRSRYHELRSGVPWWCRPVLTPRVKAGLRRALRPAYLLCRSPCCPLAPLRASTANLGFDRPISPTKAPSTPSCTCCCSPSRSCVPPISHLAGMPAPAATAALCRGPPPPAASLPHLSPRIEP
jgi:hypothetical protein